MNITLETENGEAWRFEGLETDQWWLERDKDRLYIRECTGHIVRGKKVQ